MAAITSVAVATTGLWLSAAPAQAAASWTKPAPASVHQLVLSADRLSGLDARGSYQPWVRPARADGIDEELSYSASLPDASGIAASGSRLLLATGSEVRSYDQGKLVGTLSGSLQPGSLSGPYYLTASGQVRRVDGKTYPQTAQALFGSLAARFDAGSGALKLKDVTSTAAERSVSLEGFSNVEVTGISADHVLLSGTDPDGYRYALAVAYTLAEPLVYAKQDAEPLAIGDGYAVVEIVDLETSEPGLYLWNLAAGQETEPLADGATANVTTDGNSRVAYTAGPNLMVEPLSGIWAPHTVALGVLAPKTFVAATGAPKWALEVDANESLAAGTLTIRKGTTSVRTITVAAADSGSVRLQWDGKDANQNPVAAGDYTWSLVMAAADGRGQLSLTGQKLTVTTSGISGPTPKINDTAPVFGKVLTVDPGTWSPADPAEPVALAYQWRLNGADIPGQTKQSYTVRAADLGGKLSVTVTGTKPGYAPRSMTSAATATVVKAKLATPPVPTVTGTLSVDQTVHATAGAWGPAPVTLAYQWYKVSSSGKSYALANGKQADYTIEPGVVGYRLKVKVTGTKSNYTSRYVYSAKTAKVTKGRFVHTGTPVVTYEGDPVPRVSKVLTVQPGTFQPAAKLTYKWYRIVSGKAKAISGATRSTYTVTSSDLRRRLKVKLTATRSGFYSLSWSLPVSGGAVQPVGLYGPTPNLSGVARVDQVLSVDTGAWDPGQPDFDYRWFVGDKVVPNEYGPSYQVQPTDVGYQIKVKVVATRAGVTVTKYSAATTKVVKAGFTGKGTVTVVPTPDTASWELNAIATDWTPLQDDPLRYQWYRDGVAITGATGSSLTATVNGDYKVRVTAKKPGYTDSSVESDVIPVTGLDG